MEHEVYVPFPVVAVVKALTEPERVARCVPGVQPDGPADAESGGDAGVAGRLRLRVGGSTITYRGTLAVTVEETVRHAGEDAAELSVVARGTEARGDGAAELAMTVRLYEADGRGTVLACSATVRSTGRLAEAGERPAENAGRRLLDRFAESLTADLTEHPPPFTRNPRAGGAPARPGVFDTEVPPSSLAPPSSDDLDAVEGGGEGDLGMDEPGAMEGAGAMDGAGDIDDRTGAMDDLDAMGEADMVDGVRGVRPGDDVEPPAEAAHARRTMIGRSAEEVDHAPPRGRYAPVPAPEAASAGATLRWAAPAAAVVLASAVVVSRVLRRRR